jgi:integrase
VAGKRRSNGEGTIYQRPNGKWCAMLSVGGGERRAFYADTEKEVIEKRDKAKRALESGGLKGRAGYTLSEHLVYWLDDVKVSHIRPATYRIYSYYVHSILIPAIGKIKVERFTAQHMQKLMNDLARSGRASVTVQHVRTVLIQALREAQKYGIVTQNVAEFVKAPAGKSPERPLLSTEQINMLLDAVKRTRDEPVYWVALQLGLRQGEILGLRWSDVDLVHGEVRIEHTLSGISQDGQPILSPPKTMAGKRTVPVPDGLLDMLRNHHTAQLAEKMHYRSSWKDHNLVFCSETGVPIRSDSLRQRFVTVVKRLGMPRIHFHDLRHACATMLAEQGVPPRVAMEILGHRDIATTELVYKHVRETSKREAINSLGVVFDRIREAG